MPHTDSERLRDSRSNEQAETASEDAPERETCPECNGPLRPDATHGEVACADCGLVVADGEIDRSAEWTAYSAAEEEEKSRVGAPTTKMMHDEGLSTNISWQNKDAYGNSLSSRQRQKMGRLRKWNERFRTKDAKDRNLKHALGEISRMASALGLPEAVREMAGVIYRCALEENMLPGRSVEGMSSAVVYAAARQAGIPRSLDEIEAVSRVERVPIMRTYRYVTRELNLTIPPSDPIDYVPRFASELDVSDDVEQQACTLLEAAIEEGYPSGKSPVGLAAAALYASAFITDEKVTQKRVSDVAAISKVTIRNRYKELLEFHDQPVPQ